MVVKRGHMVSEGYLKAWVDERNLVDVIDIQHRRGFPSSIKNATVVNYVYDPNVLTRDLEDDYSRIEDAGIPVIVKLREGAQSLTGQERGAMIAFLDTDGDLEAAELALGDMLLLSQALPEVLRPSALGLEQWEWRCWRPTGSRPETGPCSSGSLQRTRESALFHSHSPRPVCSSSVKTSLMSSA